MGEPRIRAFEDVAAFERRAGPWLLRREAEHNVLLGVLATLRGGAHDYGAPIYLATVELDGEITGCAFRTPPFGLGLTRMPVPTIAPLAEDVARVYDALPGVLGPEPEATGFATHWCRRTGARATTGMRQRLYVLERVQPPSSDPEGSLRAAGPEDVPLLAGWFDAIVLETGAPNLGGRERVRSLVAGRALHVWDDGAPRSMVAVPGLTPHGARVGYVYTPPALRRRGYATSTVAALSEQLLREGRRHCFLYTDLANPTSNAIYQRIGYAPVCDVVDVLLHGPADSL